MTHKLLQNVKTLYVHKLSTHYKGGHDAPHKLGRLSMSVTHGQGQARTERGF